MALNWAIRGTGRFAERRIVPALQKAHGCRLIAVISRDRGRAEAFASEQGIQRAYDGLQSALQDPAIEAVWVATPHALHREAVLALARAGRHVLCEKPLATTVANARAMVDACHHAGVALGTGFHLRHHPLHIEARRLVRDGDAGQIIAAEAEWSLRPGPPTASAAWRQDREVAGGGIVTGTGVHAIDLLRYVLDDEIETVSAIIDRVPNSGSEVDSLENAAVCLLQFRRGTMATVRCLRGVHEPTNDLRIAGREATLRVRQSLDEQTRGALEARGCDSRLSGVPAGADLFALEAEAFAQAVAGGRDPNASGLDGLRAVEATVAIYQSAATGRAVRLAT
ncbi:MAG: Gfo/Idh/MocA family protein [Dehalococcoidia bacterium]